VIVLWRASEPSEDGQTIKGEPCFLLVRGRESDDSFHIAQVVYGNPIPRLFSR